MVFVEVSDSGSIEVSDSGSIEFLRYSGMVVTAQRWQVESISWKRQIWRIWVRNGDICDRLAGKVGGASRDVGARGRGLGLARGSQLWSWREFIVRVDILEYPRNFWL